MTVDDLSARSSGDIVARRLGDSGVLINLRTNDIFELNDTGMRVWELLGENDSARAIATRLVDEFDVSLDAALEETHSLLTRFAAQGIVSLR